MSLPHEGHDNLESVVASVLGWGIICDSGLGWSQSKVVQLLDMISSLTF
jgi:hypothetical protein